MDEIIFDYNNRSVVTETGTVLDYIAEMVRQVREKAEQMGLDSSTRFVFRMIPELWEDVSNLYACRVSSSFMGLTPIEEIYEKRAELRAKQSIFVDGVEYPVELDRECRGDIFFMPEPRPSRPRRFLTAILRKIGKSK